MGLAARLSSDGTLFIDVGWALRQPHWAAFLNGSGRDEQVVAQREVSRGAGNYEKR